MCRVTERKPTYHPPVVLASDKPVQREEQAVGPATEILSFLSLNGKRKLADFEQPSAKSRKLNDFNCPRKNDKSIFEAARSGDLRLLDSLLSNGQDPNAHEPLLENTALHFAVFNNQSPVVKKLLEEPSININATNKNGSTPLLSAIDYGHSALVRILVSAGADINKCDSQGFTALHKAILTGNLEILRFLLNQDKLTVINAETYQQRLTPLHEAALHGKTSAMKLLFLKGASVSPASNSGTTPLHMAALKNQTKAMSLLLKHGCAPDVQDSHKKTPLHYACLFGHVDAATVLCKANCSVKIQDFRTETPISIASRLGLEELFEVIIERHKQS